MKFKLFMCLAIAAILGSCDKEEVINNISGESESTITVKVMDKDSTAISGVNVKLYEVNSSVNINYYFSGSLGNPLRNYPIDELVTDSVGEIKFGKYNAGSYYVEIDTPKINGIKYNPIKSFQLTTDTKKKVFVNVEEYVGKFKFTLLSKTSNNYLSQEPVGFAGVNIIVLQKPEISITSNLTTINLSSRIDKWIAKAEFSGKTDANGYIEINLPSNRDFAVIGYNDEKTKYCFFSKSSSFDYIYLMKGQISEKSLIIDLSYNSYSLEWNISY